MNERYEREDQSDWQASQHNDRLLLEQELIEVLREYRQGRTSSEGFAVLLSAVGLKAKDVA